MQPNARPQPAADVHQLLGSGEVARRLGVHRRRLGELIRRGQCPAPAVCRGQKRYWSSADLAAFFAGLDAKES
jgi:hypothetical protein